MASLAIFLVGISFDALILWRGFRAKLLSKYPFFYIFVASVFFSDLPLYLIYTMAPASYRTWYWALEFPKMFLECGIILDVFRHALSGYPGARKFAQLVGLSVFGAISFFLLAYWMVSGQHFGTRATYVQLARDFSTVQAILLLGMLAVLSYYRIGIGKNVKGIIRGYGLWIGASLAGLAVQSYAGSTFYPAWRILQPLLYNTSLVVWLAALWSYHPNPAPDKSVQLEQDYEALVARTRSALATLRAHLARVAQP